MKKLVLLILYHIGGVNAVTVILLYLRHYVVHFNGFVMPTHHTHL